MWVPTYAQNNHNCEGRKEKEVNSSVMKTREDTVTCEVISEIFHILNCGFEIKQAMIFAVMNAI